MFENYFFFLVIFIFFLSFCLLPKLKRNNTHNTEANARVTRKPGGIESVDERARERERGTRSDVKRHIHTTRTGKIAITLNWRLDFFLCLVFFSSKCEYLKLLLHFFWGVWIGEFLPKSDGLGTKCCWWLTAFKTTWPLISHFFKNLKRLWLDLNLPHFLFWNGVCLFELWNEKNVHQILWGSDF